MLMIQCCFSQTETDNVFGASLKKNIKSEKSKVSNFYSLFDSQIEAAFERLPSFKSVDIIEFRYNQSLCVLQVYMCPDVSAEHV